MSNFRRRLMMLRKSEGGLPSRYTKLNYLESTGTQYIDLGVTPFEIANMQLIFDYQITDDFTKNSRLFGVYDGYYLNYVQFFVNTDTDNIGFQFGTGNYNTYVPKDNIKRKINIDLANKTMIVDNDLYYLKIKQIKNTLNIYLFCRNTINTANYFISARIYSFKIQNGDELYRNFVPALDTTNKPCLYDTVLKQPFYNQGTGEFLYG